jgi:hypothetical protein
MSTENQVRAQQQLGNLLELLRAQPDRAALVPLIDLVEQLESAVGSFHMEAIRFRMYTLGRLLAAPPAPLPADARTLYDAIRASLEAAGFQTRSITS